MSAVFSLRSRERIWYNHGCEDAGNWVPRHPLEPSRGSVLGTSREHTRNGLHSQSRRTDRLPRLPVPVPNRTNIARAVWPDNGRPNGNPLGNGNGLALRSQGHRRSAGAAAGKMPQAEVGQGKPTGQMPEGPKYASAKTWLLWGMTPHLERSRGDLSGGGKGRRLEQNLEASMSEEADLEAYRAELVAANERRQRGTATEEDLRLINTARARHGLRPIDKTDGAA